MPAEKARPSPIRIEFGAPRQVRRNGEALPIGRPSTTEAEMSLADQFAGTIPHTHKPRREKMFGEGRLLPLDRNAKARIMVLARALMQRSEEGKHYGVLTAKFVAVLGALLWGFHNAAERPMLPVLRADRREGRLRRARRSTRRSARLRPPAS